MARSDRRRVSHEDEHEPRRRRSRDEDDRPRRRKSRGGSSLPWILGGAGALVVLIAVIIVVVLRGGSGSDDDSLPPRDPPPIDNGPAPVAWRYVPDAATPKVLTDAKMPLAEDPHRVMDIAFSSSGSAQAVVAYEGEKGRDHAVRPVNVDRFDLTTGQRLGTVTLFRRQSARPGFGAIKKAEMGGDVGFRMALSPDGSRVATQNESETEIAVHDLNANRLLKKWPNGVGARHRWLGFPDNDHVLAWDGQDLVKWTVQGGEKQRFKEVKGFPELSPNRKYVAFRTARGIDIVEIASGECHGIIGNEDEPFYGNMPMAFSRDGKELLIGAVSKLYQAVRVKFAFAPRDQQPDGNDFERELETGAMNICRRDLTRNVWVDKTRAPLGPGPARFVEGGFLAQGWCLYQTGKLLPFARYLAEPPLIVAKGTPDGRLWVVEPTADGKGRVFYPRPVINAAARAVLQRLEKGDIRPAIPPGSDVRIAITATSDGLKRSLEDAAGLSLVNSGLKPAAAGDLTLTINAKEIVSGKFISYVSPGVGSENAAHRTIECASALTDRTGRVLFRNETVIHPPGTITFERGGASKAVEGEVHRSAHAWAGRLLIPPTSHFVNGELVDFPLTMPFSEKGQAPKGR